MNGSLDNILQILNEHRGELTSEFRNIVSHEYFGIDHSIIWQIIKVNLPELPSRIKEIQERGG